MSSVSPVIYFDWMKRRRPPPARCLSLVPCERPRFRSCDKRAAPFLFQVHVGSPLLVYSLLCAHLFQPFRAVIFAMGQPPPPHVLAPATAPPRIRPWRRSHP